MHRTHTGVRVLYSPATGSAAATYILMQASEVPSSSSEDGARPTSLTTRITQASVIACLATLNP